MAERKSLSEVAEEVGADIVCTCGPFMLVVYKDGWATVHFEGTVVIHEQYPSGLDTREIAKQVAEKMCLKLVDWTNRFKEVRDGQRWL